MPPELFVMGSHTAQSGRCQNQVYSRVVGCHDIIEHTDPTKEFDKAGHYEYLEHYTTFFMKISSVCICYFFL